MVRIPDRTFSTQPQRLALFSIAAKNATNERTKERPAVVSFAQYQPRRRALRTRNLRSRGTKTDNAAAAPKPRHRSSRACRKIAQGVTRVVQRADLGRARSVIRKDTHGRKNQRLRDPLARAGARDLTEGIIAQNNIYNAGRILRVLLIGILTFSFFWLAEMSEKKLKSVPS